ncbi:DUF7322 domain-containing protein [Halostella salina]|uniref:DUF7322 domain-containing protein n=1 Tax=Halostella salina TaxID=1547897 RepID=UPI000EF85093|nr:hypothetical protein [Halostella salina]
MFDDSGEGDEDPLGMEEGPPPEEELGPDVPAVEGPDDPSVDIPSVDADSDDVPGDLKAMFWTLVLLANGAVLAVSLGLMFIGFRGNWDLGGRLVIAGGLIVVLGWRVHQRYERRD